MDTPLIEFKNVTKRFGTKTVLDRVNLQIYEGQITTIIGLCGSGKSVMLKHIIGLIKPDEGTILFSGQTDCGDEKVRDRRILRPDKLTCFRATRCLIP